MEIQPNVSQNSISSNDLAQSGEKVKKSFQELLTSLSDSVDLFGKQIIDEANKYLDLASEKASSFKEALLEQQDKVNAAIGDLNDALDDQYNNLSFEAKQKGMDLLRALDQKSQEIQKQLETCEEEETHQAPTNEELTAL